MKTVISFWLVFLCLIGTPIDVKSSDAYESPPDFDALTLSNISYGSTVNGSLISPTAVDSFQFVGVAGEVAFMMMTGFALPFDPEIELLDPNGTSLGIAQSVTEAILRVSLPLNGTYTILAREWGQGDAGAYAMHLQRVNDPVGDIPISYGQTLNETLSPGGTALTYTFSGLAGEDVHIQVIEGNVIGPTIELFTENGQLIATDHAYDTTEVEVTLPSTGEYHIVIYEVNGGDTGPFELSLNLTTQVDISYGQTLEQSIDFPLEVDIIRFFGTAGDSLYVNMTGGNTQLDPFFEVFDPNGVSIGSATAAAVAIFQKGLTASGTYTIHCNEIQGDLGNYSVFIQKMNGPENVTPISYGETVRDTLDPSGEVNTFVFNAVADERILALHTVNAPRPDAVLDLFDDQGNLLVTVADANAAQIIFDIPTTGTYTMLARGAIEGDTGEYGTFLQRLNGPAQAVQIDYGETIQDTLDPGGKVDTYIFNGFAGERIFAAQTANVPRLSTTLDLYDSQGNLLSSVTDADLSVITFDLPADDTYTLLARGSVQGDIGPYGIFLQRLVNPVAAVSMTYGQTIQDTLTPGGDMDTYIFNGSAGDQIFAMHAPTVPRLTADLDLFGPGGNLLATHQHVDEAIIRFELPTSGTYMLLARGSTRGDLGPYGIHLQKLNGPTGAIPLGFGQGLTDSIRSAGAATIFSFNGNSGQEIQLQVSTPGPVDPVVELYDFDGLLLTSGGPAPIVDINHVLNNTGIHYILVRDANEAHFGEFDISLNSDCLISDVRVHKTTCLSSGAYRLTLDIDYVSPPSNGKLDIFVNGQMFSKNFNADTTTERVRLNDLPADGLPVNLEVRFSSDTTCAYTVNNLLNAPNDCGPPICLIQDVEFKKIICKTNGKYNVKVKVSHLFAPSTGTIDLTIDGTTQSFPIDVSPQTVKFKNLIPDGQFKDVFVSFSDDPSCNFLADSLYQADCPAQRKGNPNELLVRPEIYPNPTTEYIQIEWTNPPKEEIEFIIQDIFSREVGRFRKVPDNQEKLSLTHLPMGIYILNLKLPNQSFSYKIWKR